MIQTIILYLLPAIGILSLLFLIWKVPKWQTKKRKDIDKKEKWKAENEFRKTLLQVSGGLILILSLIFTWRGMNQSQKNIETGHQITRFNQAIKFLSEKSITLKLGGLYTLEHIVRESPEHYLGSVIEVISAFVRNAEVIFPDFKKWKTQYAPKYREVQKLYINKIKSKKKVSVDDFKRWLKEQDEKNEELKNLYNEWNKDNYEIKPETQIAMTVLGRIRTDENKDIWEKLPEINLFNVKLKGAQLVKILKTGIWGANLSGAYLHNADLRGAILGGADLFRANLINANLTYAQLSGANLSEASLMGANLFRANLFNANLSGAIPAGANLSEANLSRANLSEANFTGKGIDFTESYLHEANLTNATGLTVDRLLNAKSLWKVKGLPPEMEKELREKKPDLFENPFKKLKENHLKKK